MKKFKGFTLVEILIALALFAIIATITSSTLYYAFNTKARVSIQADELNTLQLAISILQQDITEAIARATRGNDMQLMPIFIGNTHYFELTRGGFTNPESIEKRSTLKRVAYLCERGSLIRRKWFSLDVLNRASYSDKILINGLQECYFNYLNHNNEMLSQWREKALTQNSRKEPLPKAVQVNIQPKWGIMNLLFIIPEALYVPD